MKIDDRVVMVTGSSFGIGSETAKLFSEKGSNVVVTYNRGEEEGKETLKRCKKNSEAILTQLDVTDKSSIRESRKKVLERFETVDILINNAGILTSGELVDLSHREIEDQIDVNLTGLINTTKIFLESMLKNDEGIIINISSGLGKSGSARYSVYSATKFGVRGFTQSLAKELPSGFRTYVVNPGMTATRMTDYSGTDPEKVAEVLVRTAEEDFGKRSGADVNVRDYI
ncbi:MAG: SDR family oxidoreductase [Candidatus Thermoplasmatota archaeon]|nr:SDR family oxidoreductase [Candidatus Thermoplasmatota archaeon]